jgi:hypothetical protein
MERHPVRQSLRRRIVAVGSIYGAPHRPVSGIFFARFETFGGQAPRAGAALDLPGQMRE